MPREPRSGSIKGREYLCSTGGRGRGMKLAYERKNDTPALRAAALHVLVLGTRLGILAFSTGGRSFTCANESAVSDSSASGITFELPSDMSEPWIASRCF